MPCSFYPQSPGAFRKQRRADQYFWRTNADIASAVMPFRRGTARQTKWNNFYTRFLQLLMLHDDLKNEAGKLTRSLISVMDSLWVFLDEQSVEPTNNRAERA